jgi:hypothetical protein
MGTDFEHAVFRIFMPEKAVAYCHHLYTHGDFKLKIVNGRETRLGDYRFNPTTKEHTLSVNNNLSPFAFLITYLHEVAHYRTYVVYKNNVKPHGKEWKDMFRKLMSPMIREHVFPYDLSVSLIKHLKNPKAATCSDPSLYAILKRYDPSKTHLRLLRQVKAGGSFRFKERIFQKEGKRRTRAVCFEPKSGKTFLIPEIAEVEVLDKS